MEFIYPREDAERSGFVLKLIGKALDSLKFPAALVQLLITINSSSWLGRLPVFLQKIRDFRANNMIVVENTIKMVEVLLRKMPSSYDNVFLTYTMLNVIIQQRDVPPHLKPRLEKSMSDIQLLIDRIEKNQQNKSIRRCNLVASA